MDQARPEGLLDKQVADGDGPCSLASQINIPLKRQRNQRYEDQIRDAFAEAGDEYGLASQVSAFGSNNSPDCLPVG